MKSRSHSTPADWRVAVSASPSLSAFFFSSRRRHMRSDRDWSSDVCSSDLTCTPDHFEPGNGVFLQRELGISDIPAIDVRNQCSGFVYGLSVADAWIRAGQYRRVLLVGAEVHSRGLDRTTRGRDTAVLFGDGAGVAILGPTDDPRRGVLSTHLYADGRHAEN